MIASNPSLSKSPGPALPVLLLVAVAFAGPAAPGQTPCSWTPGLFPLSGANFEVLDLAVFDDGSGAAVHAAGSFLTIGAAAASGIAKWDGAAWQPLGSGVGPVAPGSAALLEARRLAVYDDGSGPALYVAGWFTQAGGVAANRIARWNGSTWSALGAGVTGFVHAMTVFDDGAGPALYVGGNITSAGGVPVAGLARWNASGWSAVGPPLPAGQPPPAIHALKGFQSPAGNLLYATGLFSQIGGVSAENIAAWDGATWSPLGSGIGPAAPFGQPTGAVLAVWNDGSGQALYVGGTFSQAGGLSAGNVARWDGSAWSVPGTLNLGYLSKVTAFTVHDAGTGPALYAAFGGPVPLPVPTIHRWTGSSWVATGSLSGAVNALASCVSPGGPRLFAAGSLELSSATVYATSIVAWDGTAWRGLLPEAIRGVVRVLATYTDAAGTALYAGGDITAVAAGQVTRGIVRWDGQHLSHLGNGLQPGPSSGVLFQPMVSALAIHDDGAGPALYAAGALNVAGGSTISGIARWNGTSWSAVGAGFPGVLALASFDDGTGPALYAGGAFRVLTGAPADYMARWNGASWAPVGPGPGAAVAALHVYNEGIGLRLFAGASSALPGILQGVARWDGTAWTSLGTGLLGSVSAMTSFDDGNGLALYAGGTIASAGGVPVRNVARWNGTSWSAVGAGVGGNPGTFPPQDGKVWAMTTFSDGTGPGLYAAGVFTDSGGVPLRRIARWNGTAWSDLAGGLGHPTGTVFALASFDDAYLGHGLYGGGNITFAGTIPTQHTASSAIARWSCMNPSLGFSQGLSLLPGPVTVWNGNLHPGHTYFNLISSSPCPGALGSGPILGLCFPDIGLLFAEIALPVGSPPFHFIAASTAMSFGPYTVPPMTIEALAIDITGADLGPRSGIVHFTIN